MRGKEGTVVLFLFLLLEPSLCQAQAVSQQSQLLDALTPSLVEIGGDFLTTIVPDISPKRVTPYGKLVFIVLLVLYLGYRLWKSHLKDEEEMIDVRQLPVQVQRWSEWKGLKVKRSSESSHFVLATQFRDVLSERMRNQGVVLSSDEIEKIMTFIPMEARSGTKDIIAVQNLLKRTAEENLQTIMSSKDEPFTLGFVFDEEFLQKLYFKTVPTCRNTGTEIPLRPFNVVSFLLTIGESIDLKPRQVIEPRHEKALLEIHAKLQKLIQDGEADTPFATESVIKKVLSENRVSPLIADSLMKKIMLTSSEITIPGTTVKERYRNWDTLRCIFDAIVFITDLSSKTRKDRDPALAFKTSYYEKPSKYSSNNFESAMIVRKMATLKPDNQFFLGMITFVMMVMTYLIIACLGPSGDTVVQAQYSSMSCDPSFFGPPIPSSFDISMNQISVHWSPLLRCQEEMVKSLHLVVTPKSCGVQCEKIYSIESLQNTSKVVDSLQANTWYSVQLAVVINQSSQERRSRKVDVKTLGDALEENK